jgi:hypothetical protein
MLEIFSFVLCIFDEMREKTENNYISRQCIIFTIDQISPRIKFMLTQICSTVLCIRNIFLYLY